MYRSLPVRTGKNAQLYLCQSYVIDTLVRLGFHYKPWQSRAGVVISPEYVAPRDVRVEVEVVGVNVVLHDVLVDPADRRAPDPALGQPQQTVHPRVPAQGAMVRIVLDVQTCVGSGFSDVVTVSG